MLTTTTMKHTFTLLIAFLFIALSGNAQTAGQLTVSTTTSSAGGSYAPRHILAIWIEDDQGHFVKTLLAYANSRKTHLNTWQASTKTAGKEYNTTDAITGATKSSHAKRTCTWNGLYYNGTTAPDGSYTVHLELTDKNATGRHTSFTFNKGEQSVNLTPGNVNSFSGTSIVWEPENTALTTEALPNFNVYPNPSTGIFYINTEETPLIEVFNITGKSLIRKYDKSVDLSPYTNGVYFIKTSIGASSTLTKVLKI